MAAIPPPVSNAVPPFEIQALQAELDEARDAQQAAELHQRAAELSQYAAERAQYAAERAQHTAEIALAREREASVSTAVKATIDDALRSQSEAWSERDRMQQSWRQTQTQLEESRRAFEELENELAELLLENRVLRKAKQLPVLRSCLRYSPLPKLHIGCYHANLAAQYRTPSHTEKSRRGSASQPTPFSSPFALPNGLSADGLFPVRSPSYSPPSPESIEQPRRPYGLT